MDNWAVLLYARAVGQGFLGLCLISAFSIALPLHITPNGAQNNPEVIL